MAVTNKQFFRVKLLARLGHQVFNSYTMYRYKITFLHSEEKRFCTKIGLLDFKFTLLLAKLDIVSLRPISNWLTFSDNIPVNIQLVTFVVTI